jgi:hypothetical protein
MDKDAHASFQITNGYTLVFEAYICRSVFIYKLWIILAFSYSIGLFFY